MLTVRNRTALPTSWLEQLVDQVRPEGLAGDYAIEFLPDSMPHGIADAHLRRVRVYVAGDPPPGHAYLKRRTIKLHSAAEACVFVLAHELRHCWQHESGRRMREDPKERDADAWAARVLRRWRETPRPGGRCGFTLAWSAPRT